LRHRVPADRSVDIAARAGDTERGLSAAEAVERRARFGANAIVERPRGEWRELLLETARDPMIWFLVATGVLYASIGQRGEALTLFAAIVPLLGMDGWLHRRSRVSTRALRGRLANRATAIRDGATVSIPAIELVPGDLVRLSAGDLFPADGLIVRGNALQVDESPLTGESFPAEKSPVGAAIEASIDAVHWGFAGTRLLAGDALMRVVTTGPETIYGDIVRTALAGGRGRTRLQESIGRLVLVLLVAALLLCLALAVARVQQGFGYVDALLSAVTLAVAAIPEEFPVVFTFFLGVGILRLARRQALVRRAVAVEDIGRLTCLCIDKTGTLTEGRLRLTHLVPSAGVGERELLRVAGAASRAESRDPLDRAILDAVGAAASGESIVALFPFTEDRRRETAVHRLPSHDGSRRLEAVCKGAPETVLARCDLDAASAAQWLARADELASAHKVVACAARTLAAEEFTGAEPDRGFRFAGLLALEDAVRKGAADAVRRAQRAGIRIVMVTGDHPAYALAIARELGIAGAGSGAMLGEDLERSIASGIAGQLRELQVVARALPGQKLALVRALQQSGDIVGVTGDGVNDVPALKAADVGIAMGESAMESAREAGAIVLLDDNLRTIVNAVAEGRQLFRNLRMSFAYLLVVHIPLVTSAALIPLLGYPLLYLPIHIVWLELIIHPTAMLAFQAPAKSRPPGEIPRGAVSFFTAGDWVAIVAAGGLAALALVAGFDTVLATGGLGQARAFALAILIVSSVTAAALLTRLATLAARVVAGLTLASTLLLVQIQPVAEALGLQPLRPEDWLAAAAAGILAATPSMLLRARPGRAGP
jgi:Ca2+-transporting ATPase